jgi:hypothetical protein
MKQSLEAIKLHPVAQAVLPLKEDAMDAAEQHARQHIARVLAELEAVGWDAKIYAPYPRYRSSNLSRGSRVDYDSAVAKHSFAHSITEADSQFMYKLATDIRKPSPERQAIFIERTRKDAADLYDAFVLKLVSKIGDCDTATLKGVSRLGR